MTPSSSRFDGWLFALYGLPLFMAPLSTAGVSISGVLFILVYLLSGYWRAWRTPLARPWFWPLLALVSLNLLGMLWTQDQARGWELVATMHFAVFAVAGATLPWTKRYFTWVVRLFLAGLFLNAVVGLLQWLGAYPWRPILPGDGPVGYPDRIFLSMALANAILWILYDLRHQIVLPRWVNGGLLLFFFWQLMVTGGRAGQLAFLLFVPLAVWILYPGRWRGWALGGVALAFVALAMSPIVQMRAQEAVSNIEQFEQGKVETSMGFRLVYWEGALHMLARHPLLGVGTGDYKMEMAHLQQEHVLPATPDSPINDNPHNMYLAYLADLGLLGIVVLLLYVVVLSREAWRCHADPVGWFRLVYMGIFLLGGLTDTLIWGFNNAYMLGIVTGMAACLYPESPTRRREPVPVSAGVAGA